VSGPIRARRIEEMRTKDWLNSYKVRNDSTTRFSRHDMLRCGAEVDSSGAFFIATQALAANAGDGMILVADSDILPNGGTGIARRMFVIPFDTSGRALKDGVFLSNVTAGALTFTDTGERVGWVSFVGAAGFVTVNADSLNARSGAPFPHALGDHTDVDTTGGAVLGDVLAFDGADWKPTDIVTLLDINRLTAAASTFTFDAPNNWSELVLPSALDTSSTIVGWLRLYQAGEATRTFQSSGSPGAGEWSIVGTELRVGGDITGLGAVLMKVIWPS
jgi:hypothetical protein